MSVEGAINLIDNSAKDSDPMMYKLNLLARTLKVNSNLLQEFLDELGDFYGWILTQPKEMQTNVWMPYFKSFVLGLEGTSSNGGWLMDIITQVRVNYRGNNPEAKRFSLLKGGQKADEMTQSSSG